MANPSIAKPANPVWLNTASTVGQLMRAMLVFPASGVTNELVSNTPAQPWAGPNCHGTGHAPATVAGGFTGGGLSDAIGRFGCGTTALVCRGRGFAQAQAYPRTIWASVKITAFPNAAISTRTSYICSSGNSANAGYGIGYQVAANGTITLGTMRQQNFESALITLTSGTEYLIGCTYVSSTSRLWNVYNWDTNTYVTVQATGNQVTVPALSTSSNLDFAVNDQCNYDGRALIGATMDMDVSGLHDDTFDPALNTNFAQLVTDRCAAARGALATGGTLTAAPIVNWDETTSGITILSGRPTNGNSGSYQYALHRSTTAWTAAPTSSATRVVGLQSSQLLADTTAAPGVEYYYAAEQTDGTTTVYSSASTTLPVQVTGVLSKGDFFATVVGDSRVANIAGYSALPQALFSWGYRAGHVNHGYPGACVSVVNTTLDWQPNTTQDPVNGRAGNTLLANAVNEGLYLATPYILTDLGINDTAVPNTPTVFGQKYQIILNYLIAQGFTSLVDSPYPRNDVTSLSEIALRQQYESAIAALDNGSTVRVMNPSSAKWIAAGDINRQSADSLHVANFSIPAMARARAVENTLFPSGGGGGAGGGIAAGAGVGRAGGGYWFGNGKGF